MLRTPFGPTGLAVVLALLLAATVWAECADNITLRTGNGTTTGRLIGTYSRTDTRKFSGRAGGNAKISAGTRGPLGGSGEVGGDYQLTFEYTTSVTYQVGTYQMADGGRIEVNCGNYTRA